MTVCLSDSWQVRDVNNVSIPVLMCEEDEKEYKTQKAGRILCYRKLFGLFDVAIAPTAARPLIIA